MHCRFLSYLFLIVVCGCQKAAPTLAPSKPPDVLIAKPTAQVVTDFEEFTGHTEAVASVELRAQVTGYLKQILFKDGADVAKDSRLFEIDPKPYLAELERAKAGVVQAEARLDRLNNDYERILSAGKGTVTQEEIDRIAGDRKEARAALGVAMAARDIAQQSVDFTVVKAPFSGRISRRAIDVGNLVKSNDTILTTVVLLDPIYSSFDVDERTLLGLRRHLGQSSMLAGTKSDVKVEIGLADEEGFSKSGVISFIDNKVEPSTGTLRIRADVGNKDLLLSPGMFVRIRVPIGTPRNALLIPEEALGSDQGQKFLYLLNDKDEVVYRTVKLGPQVGRLRVIDNGLTATDRVIVSGLQRVRPGVKVNAKPIEDVKDPPKKS